MMRPNGDAPEGLLQPSPEPLRGFHPFDDSDIPNDDDYLDDLAPVRLSFSSLSNEEDEEVESISDSSTDTEVSPNNKAYRLNQTDMDALMRHIDSCALLIKKNLNDIVATRLNQLLNSLNDGQPFVSLQPEEATR